MADTDTDPDRTTYSGSDRTAGFQHAREPSQPINPDEDQTWLLGYRINRMNNTACLLGFNPALTSTLRSKRWATLVRDTGWVIPLRYLEHVEKLLAGADVDLFDVEGAPTPGQRDRERRDENAHHQRVLADLRAAREAIDPVAAEQARREARAAFDAAIAARHPEHEHSDEAAS